LGKTLIDHLNGVKKDSSKFKDFPYSRYKNTKDDEWLAFFKSQRESIVDERQSSLKFD
jgi:hypothetical protein